ncbi:MAG: cytotoxin, partial [Acidobacteria bacterium]|nr:cytotoxin [Acidobacteriota bacterium]
MSGKGRTRQFYKYDDLHNEIEVYDRFGRHLGVIDARTGDGVPGKGPIPGRSI